MKPQVKQTRPYAFALKVVKAAIPVTFFLERSLAIALHYLQKENVDDKAFIDAFETSNKIIILRCKKRMFVKTLTIIDTFGFLFRSYYALPNLCKFKL